MFLLSDIHLYFIANFITNINTLNFKLQRVYRALYDYEAQDSDEVSFREGDVIFEVDTIEAGWMTGKVDRTGKIGMLPANYVENAII